MEKSCAAALGFFDGVHEAHMRVLKSAARYAASHNLEPVAVTFDRSPKALVTGVDVPLICTPEDRVRIMHEEAGIARVVTLPFDASLRDMDAHIFLEDIVLGSLGAAYCAAGYDYRFGGELGDLPPPRFDDGRRGEFLRQRRHFPAKLAVVSCRQGMVWLNMNFLHVIQLFCKTGDSLQMVRPGVDSRN